ncbi:MULTISPECIES: 3-deoxy-D-manno-octulosonic acid kinase [Pseudoalteromonas]|uniref:3-deoxy-D-manno-octulosonic acid kinase n=1 Tax=Pseudoalteromonas ruthenica TaxID=151081 RepID=A0A0F4PSW9_9GAMM|nr:MULTISPECIES: 3-deoxy-D-manno-octulosonic acid kinase [Pseudoalteromonas]KJY96641.1 3-deoxy-D-manno-octulosonic acid kinase [Pseudoalteromonas ruthenica]KJY98512.1 3-deoxy-D-manno-octulosonic acid kinase [Pseudoalteromonas ruthenica]MCG7570047.1 3-deoxy-D-manno-octulosonic acid kinase [Pseudoalteromonas sp. CNC9-20]TLX50064.1 3-deoxy-D-manno-octulosonic acid kinase [Pseudoalteromonas ruthenica]TMO90081.1 3-deoxy-D-manno-octulosonic acid kinase [Pseudoalteromonas ruthenica]
MHTRPLSSKHTLLTYKYPAQSVQENWFEPTFWLKQNKVYAQKSGRATTYFFEHQGLRAVLRHYWRGGLIGKVLSDQYFYTGLANTRVYKEFALTCQLHEQGLPVVEPIAAMIRRNGLIYRGDIITRALPGAQSLCEKLVAAPLEDTLISHIGTTLARFHQAGVYHADLNINNILFGADNQAHVIDFDRGELRIPKQQWQQQNIARLQRSFAKEAARQPSFHWQEHHWQRLEQAYLDTLNAL